MSELLHLPIPTLRGEETTVGTLTAGRVTLVVNVASRCGLTPQYTQLQGLQEEYGPRGFTVLGVPCDQFGGQEPGTAAEIEGFCSTTYGVTFPMTAKLQVNGGGAHPLFRQLTGVADAVGEAGPVTWNFEKWLLDADGAVAARFRPTVQPDAPEVRTAVEALLRP